MLDLTILEKIVLAGGIITTSFFISSLIISQYIYEPKYDPDNKEKYEEDEDTDLTALLEEEDYDKKYQKELEELQNNEDIKDLSDEELSDLKTKIIEEETPQGIVKMYYDHEYKGFIWFCDRNHVPYRFLETAVRKYIIDNKCPSLYVNLQNEIDKSNERIEDVRMKLYENSTNTNSVFKTNKNQMKEMMTKMKIKNNYLKFKYGGKLEEFNKSENNQYNLINIDFSTFKQMAKIKTT